MAVKRTGLTKNKPDLKLLLRLLEKIGQPVFKLILGSGYLAIIVLSSVRIIKTKLLKISKPRFKTSKIPGLKLKQPRILLALGSLALTGFLAYWFIFNELPDPNTLTTRPQTVTTKIYDRHGQLLYKIYRNQNRSLVKLEDIPPTLVQATIAVEDAEFYQHPGFSLKAIFRAIIKNLESDRLYGGSTITQQLVKNTLLSPERTLKRKIKEVILAFWVEQKFSKDEILQMYLNEVGYGGAAYGVEEASQMYFGKPVINLNLAESALLAGLPASPTGYSPFGAHPEKAKERQMTVLQRMVQEKMITPQEAAQAQLEAIKLAPQKTDISAPHFVMYIKDLLVQKYGQRMVEEGGLEVVTSLDLDIQNMTQAIIKQEISKIKKLNVSNGAALVTNPKTGEVLAMVGSQDYFDVKNDGNVNVTLRPRQPGSAIKPVLYSLALENGFTAASIIPDTPITYRLPGQAAYSPKNYDGTFRGNVSLRTALGSSLNVPAVKVLSALGVKAMIERGQAMGISTWDDPNRFGLSLTLGGGEVKMTDMNIVFGTLANLGQKVNLNPVLEVKNYQGKILKEKSCHWQADRHSDCDSFSNQITDVVKPSVAFILTDILKDNRARTPVFGPNSVLNIKDHPNVAVKTGTTQNLRDNWTIGYTPDWVVAVWVGNNDNQPMNRITSGVTGASPIWRQIIVKLLEKTPDRVLPMPEGVTRLEICRITGTLPCLGCSGFWEYFTSENQPQDHCYPTSTKPPTQDNISIYKEPQSRQAPLIKPVSKLQLLNLKKDKKEH